MLPSFLRGMTQCFKDSGVGIQGSTSTLSGVPLATPETAKAEAAPVASFTAAADDSVPPPAK